MEEKNKKIFSVILMMVGALFIVISGGIFVSKTWHYLPEAVKKLCLAVVTDGFFAGSYYTEKQSGLRRTPCLLYYLGVCFTGFTAMSLLDPAKIGLSGRLFLTFLVMSVPVAVHFWRDRKLTDLVFQMLLADGMVFCFTEGNVMILSLSLAIMLFAGFSYYCSKTLPEERAVILTAQIFCWVHMTVAFPWILIYAIGDRGFLFSVLPAFLLTASLTAIYLSKPCKVYRILQSMGIILCSLAVVAFAVQLLPNPNRMDRTEPILFLTLLINFGLTIWLDRREMAVASEGFAGLLAYVQICLYTVNATFRMENDPFYPYALCVAAAILLHKFFRHPDGSWKPVIRRAFFWLLMGMHVLLVWSLREYALNYGFAFWFALLCLQVSALLYEQGLVRDICRSLAVIIVLCALCDSKIIPTRIVAEDGVKVLVDFGTEYCCILMALAIVLLGKIWYDRSKAVRWIRFAGVCLILMVLVCSNLASPALPNVLFLGMGALCLLVLSTVCHWKNYALASAITLTLVAIYLTKEVWMSIAWWVYLFAAGVGLVIYAIKREKAE